MHVLVHVRWDFGSAEIDNGLSKLVDVLNFVDMTVFFFFSALSEPVLLCKALFLDP